MRLIDADAMMKRLKAWDTNDAIDKALYNFTSCRISEAPTIRPDMAILMQENTNMRKILHKRCRRGTWVKIGAFLDGEKAQCSNCGEEVILNERNRKLFNFCSNCGADMRGGAADE